MHFREWFFFCISIRIFTDACFQVSNEQKYSFDSVNGLTLNRQHAITWTSTDSQESIGQNHQPVIIVLVEKEVRTSPTISCVSCGTVGTTADVAALALIAFGHVVTQQHQFQGSEGVSLFTDSSLVQQLWHSYISNCHSYLYHTYMRL